MAEALEHGGTGSRELKCLGREPGQGPAKWRNFCG